MLLHFILYNYFTLYNSSSSLLLPFPPLHFSPPTTMPTDINFPVIMIINPSSNQPKKTQSITKIHHQIPNKN